MTIREKLEHDEDERLSSYAVRSSHTKGRAHPIVPCDMRTDFQRDRDRILHCNSFRRLKYKTQCFLPDSGDHTRTRLTHTLEVAQIARTVARALRLNEDLTEAIALAHDLGHTCFGHMGERALNRLSRDRGGFEHNIQSFRVIDRLENGGGGLNLCYEVCDGVLNHRSDGNPSTLEGQAVSLADRIAYISHDIQDAVRFKVLSCDEIPRHITDVLGNTHGERIDVMVRDIVSHSEDKPYVKMSADMFRVMNELRNFLFTRVYLRKEAEAEEAKVSRLIEALYAHYMQDPETFEHMDPAADDHTAVKDYIAGMTDRFAVREFRKLFLPQAVAPI